MVTRFSVSLNGFYSGMLKVFLKLVGNTHKIFANTHKTHGTTHKHLQTHTRSMEIRAKYWKYAQNPWTYAQKPKILGNTHQIPWKHTKSLQIHPQILANTHRIYENTLKMLKNPLLIIQTLYTVGTVLLVQNKNCSPVNPYICLADIWVDGAIYLLSKYRG